MRGRDQVDLFEGGWEVDLLLKARINILGSIDIHNNNLKCYNFIKQSLQNFLFIEQLLTYLQIHGITKL